MSCGSDERIKQNIHAIASTTDPLADIMLLRPVTFTMKADATNKLQYGFLAQQVQQVFPTLVSLSSATTTYTPDGTLTLAYDGLIAPIVSAIQEIANVGGTFQQNLIAWLGNAQNGIGDLYATVLHASEGHFSKEVCIGESGGGEVCLTGDQLAALLSAAGASETPESVTSPASNIRDLSIQNPTPNSPESVSSATSTATSTTSNATPPVIQINGANPAIIQVGNTYNDLGATITGPQADLNRGGPDCLNRFSASISGASASVRLPSGEAAG